MIDTNKLLAHGALEKQFKKAEIIFKFGQSARFYFQIVSGQIKMNNYNDEGREFVQGMFKAGESFGEPPLFGDFTYPAGAVALVDSTLLVLPKTIFFKLLSKDAAVALNFTKVLAKRLHYKATIAAEMSTQDSGHRILTLLDYFKAYNHQLNKDETYAVELTRQQFKFFNSILSYTHILNRPRDINN